MYGIVFFYTSKELTKNLNTVYGNFEYVALKVIVVDG